MKHLICLLAILCLLLARASAQNVTVSSVAVSENGTLVAPTNFFSANSGNITSAIGWSAVGNGTTLNWAAGSVFSHTLSANTNLAFSNVIPGKSILVRITGAGGWGVNWPAGITWLNGTPGVPPTGETVNYRLTATGLTTFVGVIEPSSVTPLPVAAGGTGTNATRTLIGPAEGINVANGALTGTTGNITLSLTGDLAGLESLTTLGLHARSANGTWTARTITAGDSNIIWTNGNGTAGNPTISLNATQTGNRTYVNNVTVQGNTTLGDASGDLLTITSQTITASNANGTAAGNIANVGTLDGRYMSLDAAIRDALYVFSPLGTSPTVANSGGGVANWSLPQGRAAQVWTTFINPSSAAGWSRARWSNFLFFDGDASNTPTTVPFVLVFRPTDNTDTTGGLATTWYFGASSTANNTGGNLTERSMRVRIAGAGGSNFDILCGTHDGTTGTTSTAVVNAAAFRGGMAIQWLPVGSPAGAGSVLRVLGRALGATDWTVLSSITLSGSIGATTFAGPNLELVLATTGTSPAYTFRYEIYNPRLMTRN